MELGEFIEEDIISFLDKEAERIEDSEVIREDEFAIFNFQKDYAKEIEDMLEHNDVRAAKKLFEELQNKYMACTNKGEKKKIKKILEEVYKKLKLHVSLVSSEQSLEEDLLEFERIGIEGIEQAKKYRRAAPAQRPVAIEVPVQSPVILPGNSVAPPSGKSPVIISHQSIAAVPSQQSPAMPSQQSPAALSPSQQSFAQQSSPQKSFESSFQQAPVVVQEISTPQIIIEKNIVQQRTIVQQKKDDSAEKAALLQGQLLIDLRALINEIQILVQKSKFDDAISKYSELKHTFRRLSEDLKKKEYDNALAVYRLIKSSLPEKSPVLRKKSGFSPVSRPADKPVGELVGQPESSKPAILPQLLLSSKPEDQKARPARKPFRRFLKPGSVDFDYFHSSINLCLMEKDYEQAHLIYLDARQVVSQLPDDFPDAKEFSDYLNKAHELIEFLRGVQDRETSRKRLAPPVFRENDERQMYIHGIYEMFHGDRNVAKQDFNKVLALNPRNTMARLRLQELGES